MSPVALPWKINQLVDIETLVDGVVRNYASRIEDLRYGDIGLATPIERGKYVPFSTGQPVTVYITVRGLYYFFHTHVSEMVRDPIPVLWVAKPRRTDRLERRRYVRVSVDIRPDEFLVMGPSDSDWKPVRVKILDISAGGIRFTCRDALPKDARIKTTFRLPTYNLGRLGEEVRVRTDGRVVRLEPPDNPFRPQHKAGASFQRLGYREQEAIIKFVLRRQAEMIRRGHV
jgi:c-di-GMP-binding flagellar brake protein YcgR